MADAFNLLQIYQDDDDDDDDDDITSVPENHHQPDDVEDKYSPLAGHNSIIEDNAVKDPDTDVQDDGVDISDEHRKDIDQLDKFLPPPPQQKCLDELQEKINKFFAYKQQGKSFNVEVRNRKDYRNPDFLHHAVRYQDIDEIGSCFSEDVFDPHGYDESDFYDADDTRTHSGCSTLQPKSMLSSPGVSILPSGGLQSASAESICREGRHNNKSKWDKVDRDKEVWWAADMKPYQLLVLMRHCFLLQMLELNMPVMHNKNGVKLTIK